MIVWSGVPSLWDSDARQGKARDEMTRPKSIQVNPRLPKTTQDKKENTRKGAALRPPPSVA